MGDQRAAAGVDPRSIRALERLIVGDTRPDLTFILDVPAKLGLQRAGHRRGTGSTDRFEAETLAFHEKLRDGFLTEASSCNVFMVRDGVALAPPKSREPIVI